MRPKIGSRVLRGQTLGEKNLNAASAGPCLGKKRTQRIKNGYEGKENNDSKDPQTSGSFSEEADLTTILEQSLNERTGLTLTSDNLAILQDELIQRELYHYNCHHQLCKIENRRQISLRQWFLFELEMMAEDGKNFRNHCYHNEVYRDVDPNWQMSDLLANQHLPSGSEYFPIEQLIIPNIEIDHVPEESDIDKLQVDIGSVIEKGENRILPTFLSRRNVRSVFDQTPVRASRILSTGSSSDSAELQDTIAAQDERKCTLLKKLDILGRFNIPRLPGK